MLSSKNFFTVIFSEDGCKKIKMFSNLAKKKSTNLNFSSTTGSWPFFDAWCASINKRKLLVALFVINLLLACSSFGFYQLVAANL